MVKDLRMDNTLVSSREVRVAKIPTLATPLGDSNLPHLVASTVSTAGTYFLPHFTEPNPIQILLSLKNN